MAATVVGTRSRRRRIRLWLAVAAGYLAINAIAGWQLRTFPALTQPQDWGLWLLVPQMLESGTLYDYGYFVWSPVAAYLLIPVVAAGYHVWFALHVASLALLGNPRVGLLVLASFPFWADTLMGNAMAFAAIAGSLAVQGSRAGAVAFLALTVLMPRPLQLPLAASLVLGDRRLAAAAAAMAAGTVAVAVVTGYLDEWLASAVPFGAGSMAHLGNVGPTALLGSAWYLFGVPLAVWLTLHRRFGLAGLALTTYVAPQYLLALLWELPRGLVGRGSGERDESGLPHTAEHQRGHVVSANG